LDVTSHTRHADGISADTTLGRDADVEAASFAPRAFSIPEFCRRYGIGRTNAYHEIAAGRLRAVKVGRRTLVTADAAEVWLASLPELSRQTAGSRSGG
jgi:excisionase family DNA binding protein